MYCTKCGREVPENTVFCKKCLDVMEKYPVKPGTSIQLPQRSASPSKRAAPRKRQLPPEELVVQQRKTIRWLVTIMVCMVLVFGLSIALLLKMMPEEEVKVTIGQNYMTRDSSDSED